MQKKASLIVVFTTVFIDLMGFGILIPILPAFASRNLGITDTEIGIIVAAYSFMQFIFNPILGKISDRIGRRPIILSTLLITAISYLIFSIADSFFLLLLSRMFAGLGGSNISVAQAYIADITSKQDRSKGMGLIGAAFGLGFLFGPLIGGILAKYSYAVCGYGAAGFSLLAFIFAVTSLPESLKEKSSFDTKIKIKLIDIGFTQRVLKSKALGLYVIIFFIVIFSMANIYGTFAILGLKHYGFTDQQNGYLFGIIGLVGAIMQGYVVRIIAKKFDDRNILLSGIFFTILGLGFLPYGINFLGVALVVIILAIGTGILQPALLSLISRFTPDKEQGAVLGVNQSLSALARVLGPLWGGISFDILGYQAPFLTGAFFTTIAFIVTYLFIKPQKMVTIENV